ncbi:M15 family metallopeptidase [Hathewaya massiliensis]|uniref:M15 family metallopeptidase n=1 Tax=Hathewaya massiliensis TaxID=1964382 RepID=UPI00115AB71C|nr:M15 family metallopeptidase [Hathewaya massiliensis]
MEFKKRISDKRTVKVLSISLIIFSTIFVCENICKFHNSDNKSHYVYALQLEDNSNAVNSNGMNLVDKNENCKKDPKQVEEAILKIKYPIVNTSYLKNEKNFAANCDEINVVANKNRNLPRSYEPSDLLPVKIRFTSISFNKENMLRKEAAISVEKLVNDATIEGIYFKGVSAYRSYENQVVTYSYIANSKGYDYADRYSAKPGQSEHQTGLSIDLGIRSMGYDLNQSFANTKEGKWLKENCCKYGFIIRYPKEKTHITGYSFEPWHIRYVGEELATYLTENNLTLEEFYNIH